jgi:predicted DNA-binding transcriptional regulator YafY
MAKKTAKRSRGRSRSVTAARVARLYRFINLLSRGPVARTVLLRRLGLNQRGFYRDIELLRAAGIRVVPSEGRYSLVPDFAEAVDLLPFPDPRLSLGEAQRLSRGGTAAHRALRDQVERITHAARPSRKD